MGRFTLSNNPIIDESIQEQLEAFVSFLFEQLGRNTIHSIILGGSFGKGEGLVEVIEEKAVPLRDFDIYVFLNRKTGSEHQMIEGIRKNCLVNHRIPPISIDLHFLSLKDLNRLGTDNKFIPRLLYYDLRYSSILLYGNDIENVLPCYKKDGIPKFEGLRLLINKLIHSTELLPVAETLLARKIKEDHQEDFLFDTAEIYIRCAKSLLLLFDQYEPSTQTTAQKIAALLEGNGRREPLLKELLGAFPGVEKDIIAYLKFKINMTGDMMDLAGVDFSQWRRAVHFLLKVIELYKNRLGIAGMKPCECFVHMQTQSYLQPIFRHKYKLSLPGVVLKVASAFAHLFFSGKWFCRFYKKRGVILPGLFKRLCDPRLRLYASILLAFEAIENIDSVDQSKIEMACSLLEEIYPAKNDFANKDISAKLTSYFELFLKSAYFYFTGLLAKKTLVEFYPKAQKGCQ